MGTVDESLVPPPRRRSAFITVALGGPAVVRFSDIAIVDASSKILAVVSRRYDPRYNKGVECRFAAGAGGMVGLGRGGAL